VIGPGVPRRDERHEIRDVVEHCRSGPFELLRRTEAAFHGSTGAVRLSKPVIGMVAYEDGYLMVAGDHGIFDFSSEPFLDSLGADLRRHLDRRGGTPLKESMGRETGRAVRAPTARFGRRICSRMGTSLVGERGGQIVAAGPTCRGAR